MPVSLSVSIVLFQLPETPGFDAVLESLTVAVEDAVQNRVLSDVQVMIIDNGNNAQSIDTERSAPGFITFSYISNDTNVGYSAHNRAIDHSASDLHLVLNPDVLLSPSALTNGIGYLNSTPDTVMICPYSEDEQGRPSYLCKRYPALIDLLLRGFAPAKLRQRFDERLMRYEYRDLEIDTIAESVELVSGCCMLARTDSLKACAGFDEGFFLYFEDFDLSVRMREHGRLDYDPEMRITHYGGNAAGKGMKHILYFARSAIRFYLKHGFKFA